MAEPPNKQTLGLLLLFLSFIVDSFDIFDQEETSLLKAHIQEQLRLSRRLPADKTRPTWANFSQRVSDAHFRRQFRMSRSTFDSLCSVITEAIGMSKFRSETAPVFTSNTASLSSRGGHIPGEIKVAVSLRLLAGGSYLDLHPLFQVSVSAIYGIFDEFIEWIEAAFSFPLVGYLQDNQWNELGAIADNFSQGSDGVFVKVAGALDGLAVRIRCPATSEVSDPDNYYCRKGFYALNVQAICNKSKKFLWCYPSTKGSTHDAVAFANSRL